MSRDRTTAEVEKLRALARETSRAYDEISRVLLADKQRTKEIFRAAYAEAVLRKFDRSAKQ